MGSLEHPLSSLSVEGSIRADGESFKGITRDQLAVMNGTVGGPGGGSGGTILLFLHTIDLGDYAVLSSVGGFGSLSLVRHSNWGRLPTYCSCEWKHPHLVRILSDLLKRCISGGSILFQFTGFLFSKKYQKT